MAAVLLSVGVGGSNTCRPRRGTLSPKSGPAHPRPACARGHAVRSKVAEREHERRLCRRVYGSTTASNATSTSASSTSGDSGVGRRLVR